MSLRSRWSESWSHYDVRDVKKDEVVIPDVRLNSNAGWYVGAVEFYDFEEMDFYSRDTDYYPNEEMLKDDYPRSISIEEAFYKIKNDIIYKRKMERKLKY
jgi:hypothetical protein